MNQTAACAEAQCTRACSGGFLDCDNRAANGCEADPRTSVAHCGACGRACPARPNPTPTCTVGQCGRTCNAGFADCDGDALNGCETDTRTNANQCGACGTVCPSGQGCVAGACSAMACRSGLADCNSNRNDGCEVTLASDVSHCGACNTTCPPRANATPSCASGVCGFTCAYGFRDCDRSAATGCEASLFTDVNHCGGCGVRCTAPHPDTQVPACNGGTCAVVCRPGRADCDRNPANGCEADVSADTSNCGGCGTVCPLAPAETVVPGRQSREPVCASSTCGLRCTSAYRDCNGNGSGSDPDRCESDVFGDVNNCGGCGTRCPVPANGATACSASTCQPRCNPGFANCDLSWANGCEVATTTDRMNCGACGRACPPANATGGSCDNGVCAGFTCQTGRGNCDGDASNGCETDTRRSPLHCGRCGIECSIDGNDAALGVVCVDGACGHGTCRAGAERCDTPAPGFCRFLSSDPSACGACGIVCGAGQTCVLGNCL
jgi:hypothetical protein